MNPSMDLWEDFDDEPEEYQVVKKRKIYESKQLGLLELVV